MSGESYSLGVFAAIVAGAAFNLGMVIQKVAVKRVGDGAGLMRQLVRSPVWLAGFAVQFIIGTPLLVLAQATLGPAIVPGLMTTGLIVLAVGAVVLAHETLGPKDVAGILLVMGAVTLFGLSRLSVDMKAVDLYDAAFLVRLVAFTAVVAAFSAACYLLQRQSIRWRGVLRTLDAGLLLVQSNLWLGVFVGFLTRGGNGQLSPRDVPSAGVAVAIALAANFLAIAETQRAFQVGDAARLVPIQFLPQQILSLSSYFAVFALTPPVPAALPLAGAGVVVILVGSGLLARRQVL